MSAIKTWLKGCDFSPLNIVLCLIIVGYAAWVIHGD